MRFQLMDRWIELELSLANQYGEFFYERVKNQPRVFIDDINMLVPTLETTPVLDLYTHMSEGAVI